jgi:hypothetical protein
MNVGRLAARVGPSLRGAGVRPSVRAATTDTAPRAASAAHDEDNELARVEKRVNEVSFPGTGMTALLFDVCS